LKQHIFRNARKILTNLEILLATFLTEILVSERFSHFEREVRLAADADRNQAIEGESMTIHDELGYGFRDHSRLAKHDHGRKYVDTTRPGCKSCPQCPQAFASKAYVTISSDSSLPTLHSPTRKDISRKVDTAGRNAIS